MIHNDIEKACDLVTSEICARILGGERAKSQSPLANLTLDELAHVGTFLDGRLVPIPTEEDEVRSAERVANVARVLLGEFVGEMQKMTPGHGNT